MTAIHAQPLEELGPPATVQDRERERALAEAMSSETVIVSDPARSVTLDLDADDRRALRALFEARARGQKVSVLGYDSLISPNEAARILGVSRPMVYRFIERGDLAATRVGAHWRMRTADVIELGERRHADLAFVAERLDITVESGAATHHRAPMSGNAKSDWQALSDEEKEAALERIRSRRRARR
jgi:excisionase family DNA binding protein